MDKIYDAIRFDLLKEVNNIGTGSALTSLSVLMDTKIAMQVPKIVFVDFKDVTEIVGGAEKQLIGVLSHITGEIEGIITFVLDLEAANYLVSGLLNKEIKENDFLMEFNDLELSVLTEIGNIMFSSYCASLNTLTNKSIKPSVPYISRDMAGAILSVPAIEYSKISDKVLLVESVFILNETEVTGYLIMVPDARSFDVIAESFDLGV